MKRGQAVRVEDADPLRAMLRAIAREEAERVYEEQRAKPAAELVTIAEYAHARSISASTVRQAIRDNRLEAFKIGRVTRVKAADEIARPMRTSKSTADTWDARADRALGPRLVR